MSSGRSRYPSDYDDRLTPNPRRGANDSSSYGGNQTGGMPPQNYPIPSTQSYPQGSNFAYGGSNPSYYDSQSNTLPRQAVYPAGGAATYPTIASAPFAPSGQAGYTPHGQQQDPSYGQAPPLPLAPYQSPLSADSTSGTNIRCEVSGGCGRIIVKVYHTVIDRRDISKTVIYDRSKDREYTAFMNHRTREEVARVWSDGGDGPCSWHMGGSVSVKESGTNGQVDIGSVHGDKKRDHGGKKRGDRGKKFALDVDALGDVRDERA